MISFSLPLLPSPSTLLVSVLVSTCVLGTCSLCGCGDKSSFDISRSPPQYPFSCEQKDSSSPSFCAAVVLLILVVNVNVNVTATVTVTSHASVDNFFLQGISSCGYRCESTCLARRNKSLVHHPGMDPWTQNGDEKKRRSKTFASSISMMMDIVKASFFGSSK